MFVIGLAEDTDKANREAARDASAGEGVYDEAIYESIDPT
jgi:hypothetical protein